MINAELQPAVAAIRQTHRAAWNQGVTARATRRINAAIVLVLRRAEVLASTAFVVRKRELTEMAGDEPA